MTQQRFHIPRQTSYRTTSQRTPFGQAPTGQSHSSTAEQSRTFEGSLPNKFRMALYDFKDVSQVATWCADVLLENGYDNGYSNAIRGCIDVAELAQLNADLISRDSVAGPQIAVTYLNVAQRILPQLRDLEENPATSETIRAIYISIQSTRQLLEEVTPPPRENGEQSGQQGFQSDGRINVTNSRTPQRSNRSHNPVHRN